MFAVQILQRARNQQRQPLVSRAGTRKSARVAGCLFEVTVALPYGVSQLARRCLLAPHHETAHCALRVLQLRSQLQSLSLVAKANRFGLSSAGRTIILFCYIMLTNRRSGALSTEPELIDATLQSSATCCANRSRWRRRRRRTLLQIWWPFPCGQPINPLLPTKLRASHLQPR